MKWDIEFKYFKVFNKALLSKQVRRILTCHYTLMTKLLKAKYYSKSSFLEENKAATCVTHGRVFNMLVGS